MLNSRTGEFIEVIFCAKLIEKNERRNKFRFGYAY